MENLKKQRAPLRSAFTRAVTTLKDSLSDTALSEDDIKTNLAHLERRATNLAEIDLKIIQLMTADPGSTEADFEKEYESRDQYDYELDYCRTKADAALTVVSAKSQTGSGGTGTSATSSATAENRKMEMKLPKLELPKFKGEPHNWISFHDLFSASVHTNDRLTGAQKLQYLKASVEGEPELLIKAIRVSDANYEEAWKTLIDRYQNKREIAVSVMDRLFNQPSVQQGAANTLRKLVDTTAECVRSLKAMKIDTTNWDPVLVYFTAKKLDSQTRQRWEISLQNTELPSFSEMMTFLENQARALAAAGVTGQKTKAEKFQERRAEVPTAAGLLSGFQQTGKGRNNCIFCDKSHSSSKCWKAKKMSLPERTEKVKKSGACFMCLERGHMSSKCPKKESTRCELCDQKHHVIMCRLDQNEEISKATSQAEKTEATVVKDMQNQTCIKGVALQTLLVQIKNGNKEKRIRAVIDTGSQRSYVTKDIVKLLQFKCEGVEKLTHSLFGGRQTTEKVHNRYKIMVESSDRKFRCRFDVLDESQICSDIPKIQNGPWIQEFKRRNVTLTDLGEGSTEIHLLIGADIAGQLLTGEVYRYEPGIVAVGTALGWTVMGKIPGSVKPRSDNTLLVHSLFVRESEVADLWRLDTIGIQDAAETKKKEESQESAVQHFQESVTINDEGRFEIALPFIEGHPPLKSNRNLAEKRLNGMTKKLKPEDRKAYQKIFEDWMTAGIIEKIDESESDKNVHYLPHRAVYKPESETTKVRPVFDASAKEKGSPSLNDCLEKGPNLLEIIPAAVTHFRMRRVPVVSDITKAFLQISVREKDRDNLRFLWWEGDGCEKVLVYRHRRVVFGVTCSPFLLAATINYVLDRAPPELQQTAEKLKGAFYVDNCVTSFDEKCEAQKFRREAEKLMSTAKMELRNWEWNVDQKSLIPHDHYHETWNIEGQLRKMAVLGLKWDQSEDTLSVDISKGCVIEDGPITKRKILSSAHQIFDPIGFTVPLVLRPKLFLQQCWELKLGWDEELPEEITSTFLKWQKQLSEVKEVHIPRWIGFASEIRDSCSLHVFADASKLAYATPVFIRVESEGNVRVSLIQAKARVAPLKKLSIPRLELLGCLIAARLADTLKKDMDLEKMPCHYWSDSDNAIHWIKNDDSWGSYVWNRVAEIRRLSNQDSWNHVPGKLNPADLPSRGCTARQLVESKWWEGPSWLKLPPCEWPNGTAAPDEEVLQAERKKIVASHLVKEKSKTDTTWLHQNSWSYEKMTEVVAWILRFVQNARGNKENRKSGVLSVYELKNAERKMLMLVQTESFSEDDKALKTLTVFEGEDGVLRVKTKLLMRNDDQNFKTPVVLPFNHPIVRRMVEYHHRRLCHAGTQIMMAKLRNNYWIHKSRLLVKSVIRDCDRCRRYVAKPFATVPAPLPEERVRDARVFEVTGVDLTGPLFLKGNQKAWIVLYTCAVYRAVHLELVTSLSTEGFLESLRKFVARRGRPSVIYSDNGTNFVGAANGMKRIKWNKIEAATTTMKIEWKFIPPNAAWWGGWWERLIGMVKNLLRRVLGRATLGEGEMNTILCDVESVINARPLTYLTENPEELIPLTPDRFLKDIQESGIPDLDSLDETGLNRRAKYRQKLRKQLRERFRAEYLGQLKYRGSSKCTRPIEVGEVVLIQEDNRKKLDWMLGKVLSVNTGKDGNKRVATVKTATGELTRPVQKLYPLEVREDKKPIGHELSTEETEGSISSIPQTSTQPVLHTRSGRQVKRVNRFTP